MPPRGGPIPSPRGICWRAEWQCCRLRLGLPSGLQMIARGWRGGRCARRSAASAAGGGTASAGFMSGNSMRRRRRKPVVGRIVMVFGGMVVLEGSDDLSVGRCVGAQGMGPWSVTSI